MTEVTVTVHLTIGPRDPPDEFCALQHCLTLVGEGGTDARKRVRDG